MSYHHSRLYDNWSVMVNGKRQYFHYKWAAYTVAQIYGAPRIRSERTKRYTKGGDSSQ